MKAKDKGGRPSSFKEEYSDLAYKYCLLGATDAQLAIYFEVTEQTINNWKKDHKGFFESVTRGKTIADAEVAAAFHKRALGYEYEEKTYEGAGETAVLTKHVTKDMAPDPGAALNWLKNRQPDKWRDNKNVDLTSKGDSIHERPAYDLSKLNDEELDKMIKIMEKLGEPLPVGHHHMVTFHDYSKRED